MLDQSTDIPESKLRQARVSVAGKYGIAGLPQRLVRVHSTSVVAEDGLGHERDRLALKIRHILYDVFVEQHFVGGADQRVELQIDFSLTA